MTPGDFWELIVNSLRETPVHKPNHRFDVNYDDEILCRTEEDANCLADFLESLGFDLVYVSENEDSDDEFKWEVYID